MIPYPERIAGHYHDTPARYFRYGSEADFDRAGELLEEFTRTVISGQQGVTIWMVNWRNRAFRSWMFDS